jgi:hypothetical protein
MVAAVAGLEPEIAANMALAPMFEWNKPPGSQASKREVPRYIISEAPHCTRISPMKIKSGIAVRIKLFKVLKGTRAARPVLP